MYNNLNVISIAIFTNFVYIVIFNSIAILRYICRTYKVADHWYPKDSMKQARVDEYLEWQHLNTRADCALYYLHKVLFTCFYYYHNNFNNK